MGAGATAVPIYASNTPSEAEFIINDSGAKAVFIDGDEPEGRQSGRWWSLTATKTTTR